MSSTDAAAVPKRNRTFRKFSYRGVGLEELLDMKNEDVRRMMISFSVPTDR